MESWDEDPRLLRGVLDASLNGVMAFASIRDESGRIVDFEWTLVNRVAGEMVGRAPDALIGARMLVELPGNRADGLFDRYAQLVEDRQPIAFDQNYDHPDEGVGPTWFRIQAAPHGDGFVVTFIDVTAEKEAMERLAEQERDLRHIVDNATDMVSVHSPDGLYEYVTPACERLIGWKRSELVGRSAYELFHPEDLEAIVASHERITEREERPTSVRYRIRKADGSYTWFETTSKTIAEDGRIICVSRDVTQAVELERRLDELTRLDSLTRLPNRRAFMERAAEEIARARRYGRPLSLVALDVDHFKTINDTFGHEGGDRTLLALAKALQSCSRQTDLPARIGGEEFMVLLPDTAAEGARVFAERIRVALAELSVEASDQRRIRFTASLGVSTFDGTKDLTDVLRQADEALYRAKREGRDRVVVATQAPPDSDAHRAAG